MSCILFCSLKFEYAFDDGSSPHRIDHITSFHPNLTLHPFKDLGGAGTSVCIRRPLFKLTQCCTALEGLHSRTAGSGLIS